MERGATPDRATLRYFALLYEIAVINLSESESDRYRYRDQDLAHSGGHA
jgi:hypothetical protein